MERSGYKGLVDYHRADAVRILDFAHAAEYVNEIGQAVQAAGGRLPATLAQGSAAPAQTPGTSTGAPTPELVGSSLSQPTDAGEIDLLAEA